MKCVNTTGKHIRCLTLFISSPQAWIWVCRWSAGSDSAVNSRISAENRSLLCFPPHTLSLSCQSTFQHQTVFLLITSGAWNHPRDSSVCCRATWGLRDVIWAKPLWESRRWGVWQRHALLTAYLQVDSKSSGTRPLFHSESLNKRRQLILDQWERERSGLVFRGDKIRSTGWSLFPGS